MMMVTMTMTAAATTTTQNVRHFAHMYTILDPFCRTTELRIGEKPRLDSGPHENAKRRQQKVESRK